MTAAAQAPRAYPRTGDPLPPRRAIQISAVTEAVFKELHPQFEDQLPAGLVRDYITRAVTDLHGSISREALPEMVIRLADVRLERHLRPAVPDETLDAFATGSIRPEDHAQRTHRAGRRFTLVR